METALEVHQITKRYQDFILDNVSFHVPKGSIVGLIGENGAGKSTTINFILGLISKDAGSVHILGKQDSEIDKDVRDQIGVVFDGHNFPDSLTAKQLNSAFKNAYQAWDEKTFFSLLEEMSLPANKKIKDLSKGMKMKLSIVTAFSHHSKLLILDEATSGLDPIIREDILDMLLNFVQDEHHSVLVSSHITTDLEKIADYIVFIHQGKVIFSKPKDELKDQYGIIKCGAVQFKALDRKDLILFRKHDYEWEILVSDRTAIQKKHPSILIEPATIDEIMLLYIKGETI